LVIAPKKDVKWRDSDYRAKRKEVAKQDQNAQNNILLEMIQSLEQGANIENLLANNSNFSKRTLQRRLNELVKAGNLERQGTGRSSRYVVVAPKQSTILQLSPTATRLRNGIRKPIHQRPPVGYSRAFLDQYQPNQSFYLPAPVRQELHKIGKISDQIMPAGTYARQIVNRLLIDLSWNSSRLEGNTYSLLETENLLKFGTSADGKSLFETQMLLNHKAAIELLVEQAGEIGFNRYTILSLHAELSNNLLPDPAAMGRLRHIEVKIGGSVFYPLAVPQLIEECFDQILKTATQIQDPFEQAFFSMVHLPYLQPFEDVNKRVSRLAANIPLIQQNLCPISFIDVAEQDYVEAILSIYELNQIEFLREVFVFAYKRSAARYAAVRQSLGEPDPFRLRYREIIQKTVQHILINALKPAEALAYVQEVATQLPNDQAQTFVEVLKTELSSLHEGNFARYRVRPQEFATWQQVWKSN
jgi:Fic family protein